MLVSYRTFQKGLIMATLSLYRGEIRLLSRVEVMEERRQLARRLLPIKIVAKGNAPHILEKKTMGDTGSLS